MHFDKTNKINKMIGLIAKKSVRPIKHALLNKTHMPSKVHFQLDSQAKIPIMDNISAIEKFKLFTRQYGIIGLSVYWGIWSGIMATSYMSFKHGYIDYHSWQFLHLDTMEAKIEKTIHKWTDNHIIIDKKYENIIASIIIGKITKPFQWVLAYYITPVIARRYNTIE